MKGSWSASPTATEQGEALEHVCPVGLGAPELCRVRRKGFSAEETAWLGPKCDKDYQGGVGGSRDHVWETWPGPVREVGGP